MTVQRDRITRKQFLSTLSGTLVSMLGVALVERSALAAAPAKRSHEPIASRSAFPHPDPRPSITAEHVLAETEVGDKQTVRDAYAAARAHPEIFDGLYCACRCRDAMHHRSLLSCYESRQPTGCGGCQEEAILVGKLAAEGKGLDEIRKAVDAEYDR